MHIGRIALTDKLRSQSVGGNNAGQVGAAASQADIAKVRSLLAGQDPKDVDEAAVSRASQLGVELKVLYDYRFPRDERGNSLPLITLIKGVQVKGTEAARVEAASAIQLLMLNADSRDIEGWLAELSVIVIKRREDEFDEELRLEAYASRLRRYPTDVVCSAILAHTWRYWPSWAELEAICEQLAGPRRAMLRSLDPHSLPLSGSTEARHIRAKRGQMINQEIWGQ